MLIGGSQKALMTPPGIAFLTVSAAAWKANETATCPRFYTDWATTKKSHDLDPPETPYTPAVTIFSAFRKALEMVEHEGIEAMWKRHELLGRACREGVKALGLDVQTVDSERARVLTAVVAPDGHRRRQRSPSTCAQKHGIVLAPGQGKLKGKIFRIGHCGYYAPARHPHGPRGARSDAAVPRLPGEGRRGDERRGERVQGGRRGMTPRTSAASSSPRRSPTAGIALLREAGVEVDVRTDLCAADLLAEIGSYHGLLVRSATKVTKEVIEAGTDLKVVGRAGIGVDNVDVDAATRRGIVVANAPQGNILSTAEHTIGLLLSLARKIPQAHGKLVSGVWEKKGFMGTELHDKVLGIIGLGRVGTLVAQRMHAFGMKIIARDPYISPQRAARLGIELVDMDELFERADVITLHAVKTPETFHMIAEPELNRCKRGVLIVNASRGGLIDEEALAIAIKSGQVGGAALDVYETRAHDRVPALRSRERRRHAAPRGVHRRSTGQGRCHRRGSSAARAPW